MYIIVNFEQRFRLAFHTNSKMSLDLDFIRKLILVSKNDLFQINKELKDLKIIIKEELNELKELKKTVVKKESEGYIETIVKKEQKKLY